MSLPDDVERVAVFAAMVPELRPLSRALGLRAERLDDLVVRRGEYHGRTIRATVTSMGTAAATEATSRLLDAFDAQHVVVLGIAGGVSPDVAIGDLVVPTDVVDEASGRRVHPTPPPGTTAAGSLLTTDVLHNQPDELAVMIGDGMTAVDMETAAIGAVAEDRGIPWTAFRAISDRAGDPLVDADVVALSKADGSADVGAVVRYVVTHPHRIPTLARLGRGMKLAVARSTAATLDLLD